MIGPVPGDAGDSTVDGSPRLETCASGIEGVGWLWVVGKSFTGTDTLD